MWHWFVVHLHIVLPYGYEALGGILIFYSSAVTEVSMPEERKRVAHWVMFAALALVYAGFGIGIRYDEVQQGKKDRQQAGQDRQQAAQDRGELRDNRDRIASSFQATYLQLASLSSDLHNMRVSVAQAINKNDPDKLSTLQTQAKTAQQQVDSLSHELLAITMAPQVAQQLRDWDMESRARKNDLHNYAWEEETHYRDMNPTDKGDGFQRVLEKWDAAFSKEEEDSQERLRKTIATADFIRKELLQRIPSQQQSQEDKKQEKEFSQMGDPRSLQNGARYLEELARRVPPPPQ